MNSIVANPTQILSKHFQQESPCVESLWLTTSLFTSFAFLSVLVLFAKSYATASTIEIRRIKEATHLLETYCSTKEGATLSKEFALCEDAYVLVSNKKLTRMRVWDATWKKALNREFAGSFKEILNVVFFFFVFFMFIYTGKKINKKPETELYSPLAQSRLHTAVFLPSAISERRHSKLE